MSLGSWLGLVGGCAVSLVTTLSRAECTMDTECKGERICENGQCVAPAPAPPAAAAQPTPESPAAPTAPPAAPAQPPQPKMVRHSKGMMVGGIVMTSLAPVAVAVASLAWLGEQFCNDGRDPLEPQKTCDYDSVIYGSLFTAAALVGAGVPLIVIGAKKEPEDPQATATITPWATPTSVGVGLRVSM